MFPPIKINRSIAHFHGPAVVIGCSNKLGACWNRTHSNADIFYTIDINTSKKPDMVLDITHEIPDTLKSRFQLCLLEFLPSSIFNEKNGFENILSILDDHGFLIIAGAIRTRDARTLLIAEGLKYIEITQANDVIVFAKDQNLESHDIQKILYAEGYIRNLMKQLAASSKTVLRSEWTYCNISQEELLDGMDVFFIACMSVVSYKKLLDIHERIQGIHEENDLLLLAAHLKDTIPEIVYHIENKENNMIRFISSHNLEMRSIALLYDILNNIILFEKDNNQLLHLDVLKEKFDFLVKMKQLVELQKLCKKYENKLGLELTPGFYEHSAKNVEITLKKHSLIKAFNHILNNHKEKCTAKDIDDILNAGLQFFNEHIKNAHVLEIRRDSSWMTFIKVCAAIFSLGLLGFWVWSVEGQKIVGNINSIFHSKKNHNMLEQLNSESPTSVTKYSNIPS